MCHVTCHVTARCRSATLYWAQGLSCCKRMGLQWGREWGRSVLVSVRHGKLYFISALCFAYTPHVFVHTLPLSYQYSFSSQHQINLYHVQK